jgi:hypothetical protein
MYSTYLRLGLHVADSDLQVVKAARSKMMPHCRFGPEKRDARHQFYRAMLRYHHEARGLYRDVMYGEISE